MLSAAAAAAEFAHHLSVHRTAAVATTVSSSQQQQQQQMRTDAARPPLVMRRSFTFARLQQTRAGEGRVGGGSWRAEMRGSTVFQSAGGRSSINKGAMVAIGNENVPEIIHTRTHTRARV